MSGRLIGLFLGAGASYEAGMPLVWELTAEIKNWLTPEKLRKLNQGWRSQGGGYPDSVIEDFVTVLQMQNLHYESILGYLEVQYRRRQTLQQEYHGLYSWLVDLVYQLLYFRQVNNNDYLERRLHYYEGIRVLAEKNTPLWVFSLNHDLIVEAIAARFSIPIHCGFGANVVTLPRRDASGIKQGELRAEVLTKEDLDHGAMYFPNSGKKGIHLLKIHGALDVFTFNNGDDLLKLIPDESNLTSIIQTLRAANEELLYVLPEAQGGKVHTTNEISYADEQGEMQFLRRSLLAGAFKFDARRSQVLPRSLLKHFRANINFVSKLICIGYGFGDLHINGVLREWLEISADRHLEIVNPNAPEIPSFLLHLAPQVTLKKSTATDHLDTLAEIVRPSRDVLEKRVASTLRTHGKTRADRVMSEFQKLEIDRFKSAFSEKLQKLHFSNKGVSPGNVGNDESIAREWMAEIKDNEELMFERLLQFLEAKKNDGV